MSLTERFPWQPDAHARFALRVFCIAWAGAALFLTNWFVAVAGTFGVFDGALWDSTVGLLAVAGVAAACAGILLLVPIMAGERSLEQRRALVIAGLLCLTIVGITVGWAGAPAGWN